MEHPEVREKNFYLQDEVDSSTEAAEQLRTIDHKIEQVLWELDEALRDIRHARIDRRPITVAMRYRLDDAHRRASDTLAHISISGGK